MNFWYQKIIFWYQKINFSGIRNSYDFLISENDFLISFWHQKISTNFCYQKNHFLISENLFLMSENMYDFFLSEIHVFSDIRNYFFISEIIYYHVVLVSTYVPTKMGPFFRPRYPFGWILKVLSIQKSKRVKIYELLFIDRYLNGSFFSSTCNSRYPNGSLFWFNPQNICILLIIISLINMSNIMWLLNLKVYVSCLVSCLHHLRCTTGAQFSKTPAICGPIEFKPHNPPILWKEAGVKYPMPP